MVTLLGAVPSQSLLGLIVKRLYLTFGATQSLLIYCQYITWHFEKQVRYLEPEAYVGKLKEITESEYQATLLQHPLYTLFLKRQSTTQYMYSIFSGENLYVLEKIQDKLSMLDGKVKELNQLQHNGI
jgi:hypothetical protein